MCSEPTMAFEELINNHNTLITVVSVVLQALATIILVWITINYAKSTKTIATLTTDSTTILRQEFESNNRPFVFVSNFIMDKNHLAFRLLLGNSGKLPAEVKLKSAVLNFYNTPLTASETIDFTELLEKRIYYVFPNQINSTIGYPFEEKIFSRIKETDGFILYAVLEYHQIGKANDKIKTTTIVINYKTNKDSHEGAIHDMQTVSAD